MQHCCKGQKSSHSQNGQKKEMDPDLVLNPELNFLDIYDLLHSTRIDPRALC